MPNTHHRVRITLLPHERRVALPDFTSFSELFILSVIKMNSISMVEKLRRKKPECKVIKFFAKNYRDNT